MKNLKSSEHYWKAAVASKRRIFSISTKIEKTRFEHPLGRPTGIFYVYGRNVRGWFLFPQEKQKY